MSTAKMYEANHIGALRNYLVAEWNFDDSSNRYLDSSGNGHNGTCSGSYCPSLFVGEGFNGKNALKFDGLNDSVYLGIGDDYFPLNTFTVCSWIKTSGLGTGMDENGIMGIAYGLILTLNSQGFFSTSMHNGSTNVTVVGNKKLDDGKYHHVCLNYNGTKRNMYVDGNLSISATTTWTGTTTWSGWGDVGLGINTNDRSKTIFKGFIDDTRIYSSYLSSSDIQKLYAEESAQRKLAEAK